MSTEYNPKSVAAFVLESAFAVAVFPTLADENTVTIINSYWEELIATNYADEVLDSLIKELESENLPKQYFFGTNAAIQKLQLKKIKREIVIASSVNLNKSMQAISFHLVHRISEEENCSNEEALKKLLKTITYGLLQDRETGLYAESPEYVWNMLQDEGIGNIESWIKE